MNQDEVIVKSIVKKFDDVDVHILPPGTYNNIHLYCGIDIAKALGYNDACEALCDNVNSVDIMDLCEYSGCEIISRPYINERGVKSLIPKGTGRISKRFTKWFSA